MSEKFYITTSIPYANAAPHVGHTLEYAQADAIARYQRSLGKEVFFLSGTDEHGQKIARTAAEHKKTPKEFTDEIAETFKEMIRRLDISNDGFIRTTDRERHWPGAQLMWQKAVETGDIYKAKYSGYYCVGCEAYVTEKDLVDGKCPYHGKAPELIEEENYFFKLSKYRDEVRKKIESDELKILPVARKNEILAMLKDDLADLSISRPKEKLDWGVAVPSDETQVMYVWFDALSNYISGLGYGINDDVNFKKFWPADLHVIGKDILRFHAIIWPAMLLSVGLPLPKSLFVHGFITMDGKKMSKSLGNVIDPVELIDEYGADAVRYYLLREVAVFEDGDITAEKFKEAYNANLANGLGNLTSRILKMSESYFGSNLAVEPPSKSLGGSTAKLNDPLNGLVSTWTENLPAYKKHMANFELNLAMDEIWKLISTIDMHIQQTQPFKIAKEDMARAKEIVSCLVSGLHQVAEMLTPFMPQTSQKILHYIKLNQMPEPLFLRK